MKFCTHDVRKKIVTGREYFKLEHSKCWLNFEFDWNTINETGVGD